MKPNEIAEIRHNIDRIWGELTDLAQEMIATTDFYGLETFKGLNADELNELAAEIMIND